MSLEEKIPRQLVTTELLGKKYDASNPFPGPFATPVNGEVKVWPK